MLTCDDIRRYNLIIKFIFNLNIFIDYSRNKKLGDEGGRSVGEIISKCKKLITLNLDLA